jgi:DNA ligase (NAD+)
MGREELESEIREANLAYRAGESKLTDAEYDALVDEYRSRYPDLYDAFRDTLNEGDVGFGTKVKHRYVCGSLDKLKYEEPEDVRKFIRNHISNRMNISAKIDGLSGILHYENGNLVSCATRGDGYEGILITEKAMFIKGIPQKIESAEDVYVRGEIIILKSDYGKFDGTSYRNIVAGMINRKDWNPDEMRNVSFVAYTVLGGKYGKDEQFDFLRKNGFYTSWYIDVDREDANQDDFVYAMFQMVDRGDFNYAIDGLVICDSEYHNEERYRPSNCVAFKTNQQKVETHLIDVEWSGPSKDGRINCTGILEPTEIGGVIVGRCTLHNLDFIETNGVKIGDMISLTRSGDVIPKFIDVIGTSENSVPIEYPTTCPCCGSELVREGPFLYCKNDDCMVKTTSEVETFIRNMGVENASFKTLDNFGIHTISDLLSFKPNRKYKNETKLYSELENKVFTKSESDIFCSMNMKDFGVKTLKLIVGYYGWERIKNHAIDEDPLASLPDGIGYMTMNKFLDLYKKNLGLVKLIVEDSRYHYVPSETEGNIVKNSEVKGSVCFTGSLNTMTRGDASKLAGQNGYSVKNGVSKGLTYLVTNTPNSGTSKNRKAREFGTKVITESEFLEIMRGNQPSVDEL